MKPSNNYLKISLAGICSTLIAIGFGRFIYTPILPNMQDDLNLSSTTMGIISSYNYFGYLIGSIIPIIWKFSNFRNMIIFSSIFSVITIYLMGFTADIKFFIILRFLCGLSSAFGFVFTISFMFNFFKDFENKTLQLYHFCGIGLGIVIGTVTVWIISMAGLFWNHQWLIVGFIGILLCIPIIIFIPKQLDLVTETRSQIKSKVKTDFITISFGYFFFGVGYIIFGTFISAIARDSFEIPSYQYLSWIIVGFFAIPSVLFWDWISKKISIDFLLFLSCSTVTLGVSFLLFNNNLNYFLISCLLYGLGVPGSVALVLVEGKKRFIGNVNISVAIMTSAFSVGQILGPYISGILIDLENNYKSSIFLAIICLVLSSILMIDPRRFKKI
jgi:MFS family permease